MFVPVFVTLHFNTYTEVVGRSIYYNNTQFLHATHMYTRSSHKAGFTRAVVMSF